MSDIQMRFHKDMLVLTAPLDETLASQGVAVEFDRPYLNLVEPDSLEDALRLEMVAGAQCLVTTTQDITPARLAHSRMDGDEAKVARAALALAHKANPQHILVEIGPCGLPLDASSKGSLNENRAQYAAAARAFEGQAFDGFFLNGFTSLDDLKCALMGVKQVSDRLVFASVLLGDAKSEARDVPDPATADAKKDDFTVDDIDNGLLAGGYTLLESATDPLAYLDRHSPLDPSLWTQALAIMEDLGAAVAGFETAEPLPRALEYAREAVAHTNLPVAASLRVIKDPLGAGALGLVPLEDLQEYTPDTLVLAGQQLRDAGVQFLRATGQATAACTGALVAAVAGQDVKRTGV